MTSAAPIIKFPNSNSLIADDSCPAVTTVDVVSSPESPTSIVVFHSDVANSDRDAPAPTGVTSLDLSAASSGVADFSSEADLIAVWLLQPRASELPAMRKYASTFCVAAASVIISNSTSSVGA